MHYGAARLRETERIELREGLTLLRAIISRIHQIVAMAVLVDVQAANDGGTNNSCKHILVRFKEVQVDSDV